jgi:small subunit ribosomal protein S34
MVEATSSICLGHIQDRVPDLDFPRSAPTRFSLGLIIDMATEVATSMIAQSIRRLLPLKKSQLLSALRPQTGNLYQILLWTPTGGIGTEVHQLWWSEKQISDSYWVITQSKFKSGSNHGKAWGQLYWKGLLDLTSWLLTQSHMSYILGVFVSPREELIWGALKYVWKDGHSKAKWKPLQKSPVPVHVHFYSSCSQIS